VNPLPLAEPNSRGNRANGHPGIKRLPARHQPGLVMGQRTQARRDYVTHTGDYGDRHRQSARALALALAKDAYVIMKD